MLNKLSHYIINNRQFDDAAFKNHKLFPARKSGSSVTIGMKIQEVADYRFFDSQGFGDPSPEYSNANLWRNFVSSFLNHESKFIETEGVSAILIPLLLSQAKRIEDNAIVVIYETLMLFGVANPKFEMENIPFVTIMIQAFSRQGDQDLSEDDEQITFEQVCQTVRNQIRDKIWQNVYEKNNQINYQQVH